MIKTLKGGQIRTNHHWFQAYGMLLKKHQLQQKELPTCVEALCITSGLSLARSAISNTGRGMSNIVKFLQNTIDKPMSSMTACKIRVQFMRQLQ